MSVNRTSSYASVILIVCFISSVFSQSCSRSSTCKSIYDCPPILRTIGQSISASQANSLRQLACTSAPGRYPYVCCPQETPTRTLSPSNGRGNVLPIMGECGIEQFGQKILGGESTNLDEFPWMVVMEYSKGNNPARVISCGGVLINQRYVLTAAHCLVGEIERQIGTLVNVRLGEYDTANATDCITLYQQTTCADPVKNVGIEEIIAHPGYNEKSRNKTNDIGIVRLAEDVVYTDFVKPICLPSTVGAGRSAAKSSVQVAGWGRTLTSRNSNVKLKLELPIFDHAQCQEKFATINSFIDDSQICAGGTTNKDACSGDSGGPLMKFANNYWVAEGIVSFGRACGLDGWPGIYTRVSSFEDWIKSNMRP